MNKSPREGSAKADPSFRLKPSTSFINVYVAVKIKTILKRPLIIFRSVIYFHEGPPFVSTSNQLMVLKLCPFCKTKLSRPNHAAINLNEIKDKLYLECNNISCETWFKVVFKSIKQKIPTTVTFFIRQNKDPHLYVWFMAKESGIFELNVYRCAMKQNREPEQILSMNVDSLPDFANISDFEKKIESMLIFS